MEVGARTPSTPPMGSKTIHTPPAPLHGYSDPWEPYTPRKSARISQRTISNRTPSPGASSRQVSAGNDFNPLTSPKKSGRIPHLSTTDSPASPQKKRASIMGHRGAFGALTSESTASAAASLFQPGFTSISAAAGNGMLITPAKTPQKPPSQETRQKIHAVARTLFDESEIMPSPKKTNSNYVLDSFSAVNEADIAIYTDSHERIPEVDNSAENPFYSTQTIQPPSAPRRSKRQTVSIPGEGKISVEEAVKRNDGVLVVFRGKKHFRKFNSREREEANSESLDEGETAHRSRATRSSVQPRILFPPKAKAPAATHDDEEALTDIEDHIMTDQIENDPTTPMDLVEDAPGTPVAPKFAPASPPATTRTTRFGAKKAAAPSPKGKRARSPKGKDLELPDKRSSGSGKRSPFDIWARSKTPMTKSPTASATSKRQGEEMGSESVKRSRV
ncbi:hypothetical protein OQA88_9605 [Cercophora sp. LCS_1]